MHAAFLAALDSALLVGVLASVAAAVVVAAVVTRRMLRPLDAVQAVARQIAAGRYEVNVSLSTEPQLSALATDVNTRGRAGGPASPSCCRCAHPIG